MVKKKMTLEEKLEEAIIKDVPYETPKNWSYIKFKNILNSDKNSLKRGPFGSAIKKDYFVESGYKVYEQKNAIYNDMRLGNYYIDEEKYRELEAFSLKPGDLIVSCSGTVGKIAVIPEEAEEGVMNQALLKIQLDNRIILTKYFMYLFNSEPFISNVLDSSRGTAIKNIAATKVLKEIGVPIPPLKEQQRIVNKIESLFEKLDKSKELIEEAREDYEKRKSAILEKAFIGELTREYRKRFNLDINKWEKIKISHFTEIISGNAFKSKDFIEKGEIKCVKITNVGVGYYENEDTYLPKTFINEFSRFKVKKDDILISLTRSYINAGLKVCLYPYDNYSLLNQRVALIRYDNYKYLYYYLRTNKVLDYVKEKSKTTNQPNLSIKELKNMEIPIPSKQEQDEIVKILDKLLEEESKIEELTTLEEQIELLKKSILAKAFRGQLGTNCENEESALELLKEILNKE
ncbi:TPA: restriction endonuclease subunit S [Clostridium perfringens]|uniref:restriction endonuclease subunit S n=1 Tax=Clostridium perfringens TaxID=1502 RepID=UPI0018974DA7|nr:restriction endonuclease subunit S [Clostridium perfringens]EIF6157714.1 restriction endonuclease subunit S [Clostridium perfringens]MDU2781749.1 restriction endonuclease subunit S [Clostridium perfringens]MDU4023896.1 restriction endonuclease subunit S [Clostridium perfringens]UBK31995.1 restriction endonuclease subunit S [Clostridium perfringens]